MGKSLIKPIQNQLLKFNISEHKIILFGLNGSGKTTILYQIAFGQLINAIPTEGFIVESVQIGQAKLNLWDIGGNHQIRPVFRNHITACDGVILVIDSTNLDRLQDVNTDLLQELILKHEELRDKPLLVLANKQDLEDAMTSTDVAEKLNLFRIDDRDWFIQACSAITGEGLKEAVSWLVSQLRKV